jgi:ribonuclease P protein component
MSRSARKEGYSRRHRYDAHGSFGDVLRGPRKVKGRLAVIHVIAGRSSDSRLGLALTRRLVPRSVDRNRIKRMAREAFRRHALKDAGLDCVVALRTAFEAGQAAAIRDEIRTLFDQLARSNRAE